MSYALELREKLNKDSKEPIRAVIYARVSTDNEGQKESCANQVDLAATYISQHPNIELVNTFVDDGISGKNDFSRPQYGEMLQLLEKDGFDLIITKALSRLNRDEFNSLSLKNTLVAHQATILTLEDNQLHDFEDLNSGILHSVNYAMDAQYVQRQSLSGKKTQELRCKNKILTAKDCSYGYDWHHEDKSISINEEQAENVRKIFEEYVFRDGTAVSIEKKMKSQGIDICSRSISNMLKDERYIGNFYINKRASKLGTGKNKSKRFKLPKEQWVLVERPDLQIVDINLFNLAQRIRGARTNIYEAPNQEDIHARFQGTHLFSCKIVCPDCGKSYQFGYADRAKMHPIYRIKSHGNCPNPVNRIDEADLEEITRISLKQIFDQRPTIVTSLESVLKKCVEDSQNNGDEIEKLKKSKASKEKQIDNLMSFLTKGGLSEEAEERIREKINSLSAEVVTLRDTILDKETNKLNFSYVTERSAEIESAIKDLRSFDTVDRDSVLNYIDKIELPSNGDIDMILKTGQIISIKIPERPDFTGEIASVESGRQDGPCSSPEAYQ